jgi:hypothetical protein
MVNHHISLARANRRITPAMEMDTRPPMDTRPLTAPLTSPATAHPETNRTTLVKMSRQRHEAFSLAQRNLANSQRTNIENYLKTRMEI